MNWSDLLWNLRLGRDPRRDIGLRLLVAAGAVVLALAFLFDPGMASRVDETVLILFGIAVLLLLLPWIQSFRVGGLEVVVDSPEVRSAVGSLPLRPVAGEGSGARGSGDGSNTADRLDDDRLLARLADMQPEIERARGGRVLWIDDNPHAILGERRLLRALGVEVVVADGTEYAESVLERDNDFDLLITDVYRRGWEDGRSHVDLDEEGLKPNHEGVNYVRRLRRKEDPTLRSLPVLFYAAYSLERLDEFTRPAREPWPGAEITNRSDGVIIRAIRTVAEARTEPLAIEAEKRATTPS